MICGLDFIINRLLATGHTFANVLTTAMRTSRFFLFFIFLFAGPAAGDPAVGKPCSFKFVDVDGRTLSATDGPVSVLVLTSRRDAKKARMVGDRIPARCLGTPTSRLITVVRFSPTRNRAIRAVFTSLIRRKLDAEAVNLRTRYAAKGLNRDARRDMYVVADFDNQVASQLGLKAEPVGFDVLIVSPDGTLAKHWRDVPVADELSATLP
jgi:hypothetical protein